MLRCRGDRRIVMVTITSPATTPLGRQVVADGSPVSVVAAYYSTTFHQW
jgi:hypothetical protein